MKKTEIVFIIDQSGSMQGLEKETIEGFNTFLAEQKEKEGEAIVSAVLFNERQTVIHNRVSIKEVLPMTFKDYRPSGCTALLDTVGKAINHIQRCHHYDSTKVNDTIFIIITDGYENASVEYTYESIQRIVEKCKKDDWQFIFLGANIDAHKEAENFGFNPNLARTYKSNKKGTMTNFKAMSKIVGSVRAKENVDYEALCEESFNLYKDSFE